MSDLDIARAAVCLLTGCESVDDKIVFDNGKGGQQEFCVVPVVGQNPQVMYVRADLLAVEETVYVMAIVTDYEAGKCDLVGWVFSSQLGKEPITQNSYDRNDRIGQHAWARRSLRPMADLEKHMLGPA